MDDLITTTDESRRRFLLQALAAGVFCASASPAAVAGFWGRKPYKLPPSKSFYSLEGEVYLNGQVATEASIVSPGDTVSSGANGRAMFVVGQDAFYLKPNSEINLEGEVVDNRPVVKAFLLVSGALLTVFGRTGHQARTAQATIGIRGTGVYMESQGDRSYICTCYGTVDIASTRDTSQAQTIVSKHHDQPKYVLATPEDGEYIVPAPFINHTDTELAILETLVGRNVPFDMSDSYYGPPKRSDY